MQSSHREVLSSTSKGFNAAAGKSAAAAAAIVARGLSASLTRSGRGCATNCSAAAN